VEYRQLVVSIAQVGYQFHMQEISGKCSEFSTAAGAELPTTQWFRWGVIFDFPVFLQAPGAKRARAGR
jgi:hypothetical protein